MLNLKKIFSKTSKKKKVENVVDFEEVIFFEKSDSLQIFRIFRPENNIC